MEKSTMNKGMKKRVVAILTGGVMVISMCVPAFATEGDTTTSTDMINVTVAIEKSALGVAPIVAPHSVKVPKGSTALDALKIADGTTTQDKDDSKIDGKEYHHQGKIYWAKSQYGINYIPYVDDTGHSSDHKYFGNNGTASTDSISSKIPYTHLGDLNRTETSLQLATNSTWNNQVHHSDLLSELDYNNYSGWMLKIGDSDEAPYNGVDTVLNDNDVVILDFSMMMGLDIGLNGYMQDSTGNWVFQYAWD